MENRFLGVRSGYNDGNYALYGFEHDQVRGIPVHQSCYQAKEGLPDWSECSFGKVPEKNLLLRNGQYSSKEASCTISQSHLAYLPVHTHNSTPVITIEPGQAMELHNGEIWGFVETKVHSESDNVKDDLEVVWPTVQISPQELNPPTFTQSISGALYNNFVPAINHQKQHEDWVAGIYCPTDSLDPHSVVGTIALASVSCQDSCSPAVALSPPSSAGDVYGPVGFSPFCSNTSQSTAAARRAVADLFPELTDTCNRFGAKGPSRCEELLAMKASIIRGPAPILCPSETSVSPKAVQRKCIFNRNQGSLKEHSRPEPRAEQISQLSSDPDSLRLENSDYSNNLDAGSDVSCLTVTISPRYLSKVHSPSASPEPTAFGFQEDHYGHIINHVSGIALCEDEELATNTEDDMPDALGVEMESDYSGLNDRESSSSTQSMSELPETPSPRQSLQPLSAIPSPSSPSPIAVSTQDTTTQCCLPSPRGSLCSPRIKPESTSRSRTTRTGPKELLKEQNRLLLLWRSRGVSYKTIKERLGIDEAESTLRGRLRTLTKPKNQRLRKPQWAEEDIQLLLEVVDPHLPNVKWKQISETIVNLGGSYRFGPSTCKKQYVKLVASGRASPLAECTLGKRSKADTAVGDSRGSGEI